MIRQDIALIQPGESWDEYATRIYTALGDGEIANGYRRRGESLEHVGNNLEWLENFDADPPRLTTGSTLTAAPVDLTASHVDDGAAAGEP